MRAMLDEWFIIGLRGIGAGAIFTMIGLSFNIVYGSCRILNFAQGNIFVLGGFIAVTTASLVSDYSVGWWMTGFPIAALLVGLLLALQGWFTLLPLRYSIDQYSWIVSTMAVSVIIGALLLLSMGPWTQTVVSPFPSFEFLDVMTPSSYAIAILLAILWFVALELFLNRTLTGLAISALSQDMDVARSAGLNVRRLQILAFGISGVIAGSAGYAVAPIITIAPDTGFSYVLNGFIAMVVGGIGSNLGTLIGGPVVGVITVFVIYKIGAHFQFAASMLLLVAILLLRPQGLFGQVQARRV
jgi:branched-chain amino acid transport system permease protein